MLSSEAITFQIDKNHNSVWPVQVWALKSYTKSVPLYVQCLRVSSLQLITPFLDPMRDVIVSVEQTRHRLLALSCLCPGASTLLGETEYIFVEFV